MKEKCSCGAKFEYVRVESMTIRDDRLERVYEMLKDWRENHRHEFAPAEPMLEEPPTIVESGSSHERAFDDGFESNRVSIGFARNEVR